MKKTLVLKKCVILWCYVFIFDYEFVWHQDLSSCYFADDPSFNFTG